MPSEATNVTIHVTTHPSSLPAGVPGLLVAAAAPPYAPNIGRGSIGCGVGIAGLAGWYTAWWRDER